MSKFYRKCVQRFKVVQGMGVAGGSRNGWVGLVYEKC